MARPNDLGYAVQRRWYSFANWGYVLLSRRGRRLAVFYSKATADHVAALLTRFPLSVPRSPRRKEQAP